MKPIRRAAWVAAVALGLLPLAGMAGEAPAAPAGQDVDARLREARERLDAAAREVAELSSQLGRRFSFQFGGESAVRAPRALIGVSVDNSGGRNGAQVVGVSPGGPAAEAGIQVGDVITSIAGADISNESDPSRSLVEKMGQVAPNLKLQVGVLRDGKKMNFDVTPRPAPQDFAFTPAIPGLPGVRTFELQPMPGERGRQNGRVDLMRDGVVTNRIIINGGEEQGARFDDMEFATLSEKLGSYFGVKAGVLVVRAGQDSRYKLQDGDVILAIDGREVRTAQHAGRVLRSYQPGEKLTLRVQRDRKATSIEVAAPGPGPR